MTWTETTWDEHVQRLAEWLVEMEATPGWEGYARHRLRELEAEPLYAGLRGIVGMAKEARRELREVHRP